MKNIKYIIGVVVVLAIVGAYFFPKYHFSAGATNSAAGSTFNTARVAQVNITPATTGANGTSTSILNTDATDRIVLDSFVDCNTVGTSLTAGSGTGLATWQWQIATTSTANPVALGNTNFIANMLVPTSTVDSFTASSTNPAPNPVGRIWPTATYITIFPNATNTAACTAGVHYIGS